MADDYITPLKAMRDSQIEERRALLAQYKEASDSEQLIDKVTKIQLRIDALERAIADEGKLPGGISFHQVR